MFRRVQRFLTRFAPPVLLAAVAIFAIALATDGQGDGDRIAAAAGQPLVDPKSPPPKIPARPLTVIASTWRTWKSSLSNRCVVSPMRIAVP